jgi:alpha-beta hydrolase superfamily lysophospholipase
LGIVVLALLLAASVIVAICASHGCTDRLARGIIKGPNTGRVVVAADDPTDDDVASIGVDRQLRVEVSRDVAPASLSVWILEPPETPKANVFVLHGHADCKESFLTTAQAFESAGYRAVLVDLRGHGHSSGQYLTFGVQESRDLVEVLDALTESDIIDDEQPVAVWGYSYGGATAIQWAARDQRVACVVSVCAFARMREQVAHAAKVVAPAPARWLLVPTDGRMQSIINRAGRIAGFDPDDASPLAVIGRSDAPILLIHGTGDTWIPFDNAQRLYDVAAASREDGQARLIAINGAEHAGVLHGFANQTVLRESLTWLARWTVR